MMTAISVVLAVLFEITISVSILQGNPFPQVAWSMPICSAIFALLAIADAIREKRP